MINPEKQFLKETTLIETPLSSAEEAFLTWMMRDSEILERRQSQKSCNDMREFNEIYEDEKIQKDISKLKSIRSKPDQKYKTERATIIEALFEQHLSKWLDDTESEYAVAPTLEFDDRFGHCDFVLEYGNPNDPDEVLRLAIDCTLTEEDEVIEKKAKHIYNELISGTLTKLEYFESYLQGKIGKIDKIPRVIIPFEKDSVSEICKNFLLINNSKNIDSKLENKKFENNPKQLEILDTIIFQLKWQANKINKTKYPIAAKNIKEILDKMQNILDKKIDSLKISESQRVQKTKTSFLQSLFS